MQELTTELITNYFAMVTHGQIFTGKSEDDLYSAIYNRNFSYCEIAVLKSWEEADWFAKNRYHEIFYSNPNLYSAYPMPTAQEYNIEVKSLVPPQTNSETNFNQRITPSLDFYFKNPAITSNVKHKIFWAVDGING